MQAHVGSSEVQKFFYYIFSTKMQNPNFLDIKRRNGSKCPQVRLLTRGKPIYGGDEGQTS